MHSLIHIEHARARAAASLEARLITPRPAADVSASSPLTRDRGPFPRWRRARSQALADGSAPGGPAGAPAGTTCD